MIELCPESPGWTSMSPRISFSHDFAQPDGIPIDRQLLLLDSSTTSSPSSPDFRFFSGEASHETTYSCSADDLFSNGKILPTTPLECSAFKPPPPPPPPPPPAPSQARPSSHQLKKESVREIIKAPEPSSDEKLASSKAFWRFGRSTSLNCGGGSKCSLLSKLPLLNRSKSTGSANGSSSNHKKEPGKNIHKSKRAPSSSTPPPSSVSALPMPLPPMKKNDKTRGGAYGNGVRINPILNIRPPYISPGTTSLFGFGYFLRPGNGYTTKPRKRANT